MLIDYVSITNKCLLYKNDKKYILIYIYDDYDEMIYGCI